MTDPGYFVPSEPVPAEQGRSDAALPAPLRLVCERCGRSMDYDRAIDPDLPAWVATLSQSHCDAEDCDTGDRLIETWLDADGVARDPAARDFQTAVLDNVRPEIRDEVAYALDLAGTGSATPTTLNRAAVIVERARVMLADPDNMEKRLSYVRAVFNIDWTAAVIVSLAEKAGV